MRIAIAGGGPGGLYLSILLKRLDPAHEVVVYERNAPDDTFGFGVVFSDETLVAFEAADPESYAEITRQFVRWSEIDVHFRGEVITSGGHGFSALGRKQLLNILQTRAAEVGVELHFEHEVSSLEGDVVVAADGVNSMLRGDAFGTTLDRRRATYAWFGTRHVFDAFTFLIAETERGVVQVHAYPFSDSMSTFIVETTDALPLDKAECEALFGYELVENRTRWINFITVRNERWRSGNLFLLGDAAHTAHFSIGSGTKLAMEDAISLAWAVRSGDLDAYEAERRPIVESTQRAAQGSLEWFEGIGRYVHQDPRTFAFNLLTRSRRITHGELRDARPGLRRRARRRRAADVRAVATALARARQPRRGLADGHVQLARRHARRLPPRAPRRAGGRRRRARDDRDDLYERGRADHARLRRAVPGRARPGLEADRRLRARPLAGRGRVPARPRRPQGLDAAACGRPRTSRCRRATGR